MDTFDWENFVEPTDDNDLENGAVIAAAERALNKSYRDPGLLRSRLLLKSEARATTAKAKVSDGSGQDQEASNQAKSAVKEQTAGGVNSSAHVPRKSALGTGARASTRASFSALTTGLGGSIGGLLGLGLSREEVSKIMEEDVGTSANEEVN